MSEPAATAASADSAPAAGPGLTGARQIGLRSLPPLSMLFLTLGVVQIFLAGYGVFALDGDKLGSSNETAFDPHRLVGNLMLVVALLVLIAAVVARPGRRLLIMAVALLVVVGLLGALASAGEDTPFFGGLHALFGIGSLGLASVVLAGSRRQLA